MVYRKCVGLITNQVVHKKKNMGPTMHTHPYIQNIYVLYSKEQQRNSKKVNKTLGILRK